MLVLSQHLEDRYPLDLVGDRAEGVSYLLKDRVGGLATFVEAATTGCRRRVAARSPGRCSAWWAAAGGEPARQADPREREVLALIAEGHSNHGIAEELVVTVAAVERHVTSIFAKLSLYPEKQAHRRVLAVLRYLDR